MGEQRKHPPPRCVGCGKRRADCREAFVGQVCPPCRVLLAEIVAWQSRNSRATFGHRRMRVASGNEK